jgi:hypothetical protein
MVVFLLRNSTLKLGRRLFFAAGDQQASATVQDAEALATYSEKARSTNAYNDFVQDAIA